MKRGNMKMQEEGKEKNKGKCGKWERKYMNKVHNKLYG